MLQNKKGYFQGTEEPTPKKKQYKSEKAIQVQPRFKEPFYRNYDLYDTGGNSKSGPGVGWHSMHKYKSIQEFRDAKRKHMQDKYKADDSWIEDTISNKNRRIEKMKIRSEIISSLIKIAIDFPVDEQINSNSINWNSGSYIDGAQVGGQLDEYLPNDDFEEKSPEQLNFGRDYIDEKCYDSKLNRLEEKYLHNLTNDSNIDAVSEESHGITDFENTIYNQM